MYTHWQHDNFISYPNIIMSNVHETLKPDSDIIESSVSQKVIEKTDTELWKVFENEKRMSTSDFIIQEVRRLNPNVKIETDSDRGLLFSSVEIQDLVLPEWFYYNQKNGITNKHNTQSGIYGSVRVYPLEYYNPDYL